MTIELAEHSHTTGSIAETHYTEMRNGIAALLAAATQPGAAPIFETDADPAAMWLAYLDGFPADERQHHTCSSCRHFIQRFGHLVTVNADGTLASAVWPELSMGNPYGNGVRAMVELAAHGRKIAKPFHSSETTYGTPVTGGAVTWTHMYAKPHPKFVHTNRIKTAGQVAAEKVQNFGIVRRALNEWPLLKLQEAKVLLQSGGLSRAHNVLPGLDWLLNLSTARVNDALLWNAVATAPDAFCHPRSGAIGSLMDDLMSGMDVESVKRRFAAVMNPYTYQRSQTAPSVGAINQAEKLLAASGAAPALARRVALLSEVQTFWSPSGTPGKPERVAAADGAAAAGIFDHLRPANPASSPALGSLRVGGITWAKFKAQILPTARAIEAFVPSVGNFVSTLTAVAASAPAILQWDVEGAEQRNPFSQYGYIGGTQPARWGLVADTFVEVVGLMASPAHWHGNPSHHPESVTFLLPQMRDSKNTASGLFPQILKQDFHPVRAVIEAHCNRTPAAQPADGQATANGIRLESTGTDTALVLTVRVTLPTGNTVLYRIDRWD